MARQHIHYRKPVVGDLVHPIEHASISMDNPRRAVITGHPSSPRRAYADIARVGLVIDTRGTEVLVQFAGEKDDIGQPYRLWYRRTNVVTIDGVREIS